MLNYNPSQLVDNVTLLEQLHKIQAYLQAHPSYQIYSAKVEYNVAVQSYDLTNVVIPEGTTLGVGDVVLFTNAYVAVVKSTTETTFVVESATRIEGERGATGPQGATGATGPQALTYNAIHQEEFCGDLQDEPIYLANEQFNREPSVGEHFTLTYYVAEDESTNMVEMNVERINDIYEGKLCAYCGVVGDSFKITGPQGVQGVSIFLYDGEVNASVVERYLKISQVTIPQGYSLKVGDIILSTYNSSIGAFAQVTTVDESNSAFNVDFIGTLNVVQKTGNVWTKKLFVGTVAEFIEEFNAKNGNFNKIAFLNATLQYMGANIGDETATIKSIGNISTEQKDGRFLYTGFLDSDAITSSKIYSSGYMSFCYLPKYADNISYSTVLVGKDRNTNEVVVFSGGESLVLEDTSFQVEYLEEE